MSAMGQDEVEAERSGRTRRRTCSCWPDVRGDAGGKDFLGAGSAVKSHVKDDLPRRPIDFACLEKVDAQS